MKLCCNCKHFDVDVSDDPCYGCFHGEGRSGWEAQS